MILGFIFAIIVSVLFAVYAVPRKFSQQNVWLYTMWMGVAYFIGTLFVVAVMWGGGFAEVENLLDPWHWVTVLRGFIWVLGMAAYNLAIDKIGLTRFNQWKNFQGPVGSLLMLFLLAEVVGLKVLWLILGMFAMFISAMLFTIRDDTDFGKKNTFFGVSFAFFAAVCFGITALLNKIVSDQGFLYAQLLYHSFSLVVFSAMAYLIVGERTLCSSRLKIPEVGLCYCPLPPVGLASPTSEGVSQSTGSRRAATDRPTDYGITSEAEPMKERFRNLIRVDKKTWLPFLAGGMFLVATLLIIIAYRLIAGPVVWSITQLNVVWTILIGIFIFKEVDFQTHWLRISAGFLIALAAIALLFFAL